MLLCLFFVPQIYGQARVKSAAECAKLVPGNWGANFGQEWHEHEAVYWGCRLGASSEAVKNWQDPFGIIQDLQLASINGQEFAFVEHMEGTEHCYSFKVFRKTNGAWEQVWQKASEDFCMVACPPIRMAVLAPNLILQPPRSSDPRCKDVFSSEEYRWNGKGFDPVTPHR
jgi:hypothetical protein